MGEGNSDGSTTKRESEIPKHGLRLLVIKPQDFDSDSRGRLKRNQESDRRSLTEILDKKR